MKMKRQGREEVALQLDSHDGDSEGVADARWGEVMRASEGFPVSLWVK
jgi:hypothetical protein